MADPTCNLLPCPFCNCADVKWLTNEHNPGKGFFFCEGCDASTGCAEFAEAAARWNRRPLLTGHHWRSGDQVRLLDEDERTNVVGDVIAVDFTGAVQARWYVLVSGRRSYCGESWQPLGNLELVEESEAKNA